MSRKIFFLVLILCLMVVFTGCKDSKKGESLVVNDPNDATSDTTAPTISSVSPGDASTDIAISTSVVITFSEGMDTTTIDAATDNTECSGSIQLSSDGFTTCLQMDSTIDATSDNKEFTVTPAADLSYDTTYKIKVGTGVTDVAANAMESEYVNETGFTSASAAAANISGTVTAYQIVNNWAEIEGLTGVTVKLCTDAACTGGTLIDQTTTAADGTYSFANVDVGDFKIQMSKTDYDNKSVDFSAAAGTNDAGSERVEITVGGAEAFRYATLIDFGDSSAEVGKTLNLRDAGNAIVDTCVTIADGKYALKGDKNGVGYNVDSPDGTVNDWGTPTTVAQGVTFQTYTLN